ncbi:hypothetical protein L226DRAFT_449240, partial [Lentinus tigrinus ALCF2SS1-7]
PSKSLCLSPFYQLPAAWEAALRAVSPVPLSVSSAVYFYPPPFLLDTISSLAPLADDCEHPQHARSDEKVHRYLHNLVRIRRFLRARIFDPSLSHEPLSISEWRAALWGDYQMKTHPPNAARSPSDLRRAQRRQDRRNAVSRLFARVAQLRSYREDELVRCGEDKLEMKDIAKDSHLRRRLLWEAHELNFRAEIMALDTLLVQKSTWLEVHRWEREGQVSTIWGPRASAISILPTEDSPHDFRWTLPARGGSQAELSLDTLVAFARVMTRWPGCPEEIVQAGVEDVAQADMERVQALAVNFYVRTFVKHYLRLPVPP